MDSVPLRDRELDQAFHQELRRVRSELQQHLKALQADGDARDSARSLERILQMLRGTCASVRRADLTGCVAGFQADLQAAVDRGYPLAPDAVARLAEDADAFLVAAGLDALTPAPSAPAALDFAQELARGLHSLATVLPRINDATLDRPARTAARESAIQQLHALKGGAVLEGELRLAAQLGRLSDLAQAVDQDPLGLALAEGLNPLFARHGIERATAAPSLRLGGGPDTTRTRTTGEAGPVIEPETQAALQRLRVLFVEDTLSMRRVAEKFLLSLGVGTVVTAADGLAALECLRAGRFDLIFSDLEMPRMHGYELLAHVRASPEYRDLPVIIVTARTATRHRFSAEVAGATDYMVKPFTRESLLEKLKAHGRL